MSHEGGVAFGESVRELQVGGLTVDGNVTFLFTDIEGSTQMWDQDPERMTDVLSRHDAILGNAITNNGGTVVVERGEGDSFFAVFGKASDAARAAIACQEALQTENWPEGWTVQVRIAIHTGEANAQLRGTDVNRAARIRGLAHGGQILVSSASAELIRNHLDSNVRLLDLGEFELRGIKSPERIHQLSSATLRADFPPLSAAAPRYVRVPSSQGPSLFGREDTLAILRELVRDPQEGVRVVALTGMAGIGKTAIALETVRLTQANIQLVWWIDASNESASAADLAMLAAELGVPKGETSEELVRGIEEWLADHEGWLLIFDDALSPESIAELIPKQGKGTVLVTSRYPDWSFLGESIEVGELDGPSSVQLLRGGWPGSEEADLQALANSLGGHPLALWQAATYARLTGISAPRYLELLTAQMSQLLSRGQSPQDYSLSASATVSLSIERLPADAPLAHVLLGTLSYLGSSQIPAVFFRALTHPEEFNDQRPAIPELELMDARAVLRAASLLHYRQGGMVAIHPIVAAVSRDLWDPFVEATGEEHPVHLALHAIHLAQWKVGSSDLPGSLGLVDHAVSASHFAIERALAVDEAFFTLHNAAHILTTVGEPQSAANEYRTMLEVVVPVFGEGSPQHAGTLCNLAVALGALNEIDESQRLLREAIDISSRAGPGREGQLAIQLGNLAMALLQAGDPTTALRMADEALAITQSQDHEDRAITLAKKARSYGSWSDSMKPRVFLRKRMGKSSRPNLRHRSKGYGSCRRWQWFS